ncbi:MAG TPA: hypothetical protein PL030_12760 [Smithella sp.]|nr:hypothetical protein [Smithella sp.]
MKRIGMRKSLMHRLVCSALATFRYRTPFCFCGKNSSVAWHRTILCLTQNIDLNRQINICARKIGYGFLNKVHESVLLRDCYRDITVVDKNIFATRFWQQYCYIQNQTSDDSDKKLLVIVDAHAPAELQGIKSLDVKIFRVNDSGHSIIGTIQTFSCG